MEVRIGAVSGMFLIFFYVGNFEYFIIQLRGSWTLGVVSALKYAKGLE